MNRIEELAVKNCSWWAMSPRQTAKQYCTPWESLSRMKPCRYSVRLHPTQGSLPIEERSSASDRQIEDILRPFHSWSFPVLTRPYKVCVFDGTNRFDVSNRIHLYICLTGNLGSKADRENWWVQDNRASGFEVRPIWNSRVSDNDVMGNCLIDEDDEDSGAPGSFGFEVRSTGNWKFCGLMKMRDHPASR
jgi:hypothetical protein